MKRIDREGIAGPAKTGDRPMTWIISSRAVRSGATGWSGAGARRCAKGGSASANGAVSTRAHTIQNRSPLRSQSEIGAPPVMQLA